MKVIKIFCAFLLVFSIVMLNACQTEISPQEQVYRDYLDACKTDIGSAIREYCHYENADYYGLAIKSSGQIHSYEILDFKKLSDELWVVQANIKGYAEDDGDTVYNFVGEIDGRYWVMPSDIHIPQKLTIGLDLSPYENPDAL